MPTFTTDDAVFISVRMPRQAWPEGLKPPAHHFLTSITLIRGRLTIREAVMSVRVEGSIYELQEALYRWKCCGFKVEESDRNGIQDSLQDPENRIYPLSFYGRGNPSRDSLVRSC